MRVKCGVVRAPQGGGNSFQEAMDNHNTKAGTTSGIIAGKAFGSLKGEENLWVTAMVGTELGRIPGTYRTRVKSITLLRLSVLRSTLASEGYSLDTHLT